MKNKIKIFENEECEKNKDITNIKNLVNSNTFNENLNIAENNKINNPKKEKLAENNLYDD